MAINSFSSATVADDASVTSTVNKTDLVTKIQEVSTDTYFDETSELKSVLVMYTHQDGRQKKTISHTGSSLTSVVSWSPSARDGTWQKTLVEAFDYDGAKVILSRANIGTAEDLTHSGGIMSLNV